MIVMSGPSGAGKTSVVEGLSQRMPFHFSVSMTTRPARPGETDGVDYHFVTRDRFAAAIEAGELAEWASYGGNLYGTPVAELDHRAAGEDVLADIEMVGARTIKNLYPEAVMIFVAPPGLAELERRLRERGDTTEEDIRRRLEIADGQMREAVTLFDHIVVNDDLNTAIDRVAGILRVPHRPDPS
ncbi:MAG: guanylate kinase [Actinomycetota bacterium]